MNSRLCARRLHEWSIFAEVPPCKLLVSAAFVGNYVQVLQVRHKEWYFIGVLWPDCDGLMVRQHARLQMSQYLTNHEKIKGLSSQNFSS